MPLDPPQRDMQISSCADGQGAALNGVGPLGPGEEHN